MIFKAAVWILLLILPLSQADAGNDFQGDHYKVRCGKKIFFYDDGRFRECAANGEVQIEGQKFPISCIRSDCNDVSNVRIRQDGTVEYAYLQGSYPAKIGAHRVPISGDVSTHPDGKFDRVQLAETTRLRLGSIDVDFCGNAFENALGFYEDGQVQQGFLGKTQALQYRDESCRVQKVRLTSSCEKPEGQVPRLIFDREGYLIQIDVSGATPIQYKDCSI